MRHALTRESHPAPDCDKRLYTAMQNTLPEWNRDRNAASRLVVSKVEPREYCSIACNQSGFDVDIHTGRPGHTLANFSKISDFHVDPHRPLPDDVDITEIIPKRQKISDWTVSIVVNCDDGYLDKPAVEDIEETIGIDLGITTLVHDSENRPFAWLDEETDRNRIERRHRSLSHKYSDPESYQKARQSLARANERFQQPL